LAKSVQGEKYTWQMGDDPIGSGDAGEVYTASCVQKPELTGVLKKPARIATGGTIQRQAQQIAQESLALERLDGIPRGKAHPPRLLDQAPAYTKGTANFFIISETAPGKTMADLIKESRQTGKPFPRRVIITVLDALFDLFSRAHKAGVLWNDVKLDHIYWHNPSGQIGVIDWGNALFLDTDGAGSHPAPPRWEDYQQMVETLGGFLKQSAPDLYAELGWEEFQNQTLDSPMVSILARRIAFQQQVVALRVMEYQSLIRVVLTAEPSLEGLEKIKEYQQILVKIGAPWESKGVLDYANQLIKQAAQQKDRQITLKAITIVWDLYEDSLDLPWHLLRAYFRQVDLISHQDIGHLVKVTLDSQWDEVLWTLIKIARDEQACDWWEKLVPVIRQQATGLIQARPFIICQSLKTWMQSQSPGQNNLVMPLNQVLSHWRDKGDNLEGSPFDYEILDLLREDSNELPADFRTELRKSFAFGEGFIRELIKYWETENWEPIDHILRQIATWDPDRWGLIPLAKGLTAFKTWLQTLYDGPHPDLSAHQFLKKLLDERPPVDRALGTPAWLVGQLPLLQAIFQGDLIEKYRPQISHWCPWLLAYEDIHTPLPETPAMDEDALEEALTNFAQHLKNWSDIDAGLAHVRSHSRVYYRFCKQLIHCFKEVFALNADLDHCQSLINTDCHPTLNIGCQALGALIDWRKNILENNLESAINCLDRPQFEAWVIINQVRQDTSLWQQTILPAIQSLSVQPHPFKFEYLTKSPDSNMLMEVFTQTQDIHQTWDHLYLVGLQPDVINQLQTQIDKARLAFFRWRQSLENSDDPISVFLFHNFLSPIREVSDLFLRLSQHIHQVTLSLNDLENARKFALSVTLTTGENLLQHLRIIEEHLLSTAKEGQKFPTWEAAYQQIIEADSPETRQIMVLSLADDHPLSTWLLRSTFDTTP